jgi:hypothetical protein
MFTVTLVETTTIKWSDSHHCSEGGCKHLLSSSRTNPCSVWLLIDECFSPSRPFAPQEQINQVPVVTFASCPLESSTSEGHMVEALREATPKSILCSANMILMNRTEHDGHPTQGFDNSDMFSPPCSGRRPRRGRSRFSNIVKGS